MQTIRAAACLQSILDPTNRPAHLSARLKRLPGSDRYPAMKERIGANEFPLVTGGRREGHGMVWSRAILDGDPYPVRSMLIAGGNPMVTFPATSRQCNALRKLDFLAVFDLFLTPTARLADLVFPAADHLDNLELHDYGREGRPYLGLMRPATSSPKGWPTWKLVFELARSLGIGDLFPWKDNREAIAHGLSGTGVTLVDLERSESSTVAYQHEEPSENRWHTRDGRLHYLSAQLADTGNEALPVPAALGLPYAADEAFPFWLSMGDRVAAFQHGQYREIPAYARLGPDPMVEIHPDAARCLGIQTGDLILLSTRYGGVEIRAHLSHTMRTDCLRMTHGWEEPNANELTGLEYLDRVSGFPWFKAVPAQVEKKRA